MIENLGKSVERMWSRNPLLMLMAIIFIVPLLASFTFGYYVMQNYNSTMSSLSDNMTALKLESQKQTLLLLDIKYGLGREKGY